MKLILFVGENAAGTGDLKMHQAMHKKIRLCRLGRNWFSNPGQGKGGPCDLQENANRVKNFHPTHPPGGSKTLSSAF